MISDPSNYIMKGGGASSCNQSEEGNGHLQKNVSNKHKTPTHEIRNVRYFEEQDSFLLTMDMPGVKKEHVSITTTHENKNIVVLSIEASRTNGGDEVVSKYQGHFQLDKKLTRYKEVKVMSLIDGVLTITIPKAPAPKTINIAPVLSDPPQMDDGDAKENILFQVDVPGVKLSNLSIQLTGDELSIVAERITGTTTTSVVRRTLTLADDDDDDKSSFDHGEKIKAYLSNGVLTLTTSTIPKQDTETGNSSCETTNAEHNDQREGKGSMESKPIEKTVAGRSKPPRRIPINKKTE